MGPDIAGETVMAVIGHSDRVRFVAPRDSHENRPENLLARQPPIIRDICKDSREREISFAQWPLFGGQTAKDQLPLFTLHSLLDIGANLFELFFVDDGANIGVFIQWVAELQQPRPVSQFVEETVEDIGMQKEARACRAGLALPRKPHC